MSLGTSFDRIRKRIKPLALRVSAFAEVGLDGFLMLYWVETYHQGSVVHFLIILIYAINIVQWDLKSFHKAFEKPTASAPSWDTRPKNYQLWPTIFTSRYLQGIFRRSNLRPVSLQNLTHKLEIRCNSKRWIQMEQTWPNLIRNTLAYIKYKNISRLLSEAF